MIISKQHMDLQSFSNQSLLEPCHHHLCHLQKYSININKKIIFENKIIIKDLYEKLNFALHLLELIIFHIKPFLRSLALLAHPSQLSKIQSHQFMYN